MTMCDNLILCIYYCSKGKKNPRFSRFGEKYKISPKLYKKKITYFIRLGYSSGFGNVQNLFLVLIIFIRSDYNIYLEIYIGILYNIYIFFLNLFTYFI